LTAIILADGGSMKPAPLALFTLALGAAAAWPLARIGATSGAAAVPVVQEVSAPSCEPGRREPVPGPGALVLPPGHPPVPLELLLPPGHPPVSHGEDEAQPEGPALPPGHPPIPSTPSSPGVPPFGEPVVLET
jgi:hypothetical protein